jgi:plastocyanin
MRTIVAVAASLALLGACAGGDAAAPKAARVTVREFAFGPRSISVQTGGSVTWTNRDEFDHAVQIDALHVDGAHFGPQSPTKSYMHRFTKSGTYSYVCAIHNSMTGTVIVTD